MICFTLILVLILQPSEENHTKILGLDQKFCHFSKQYKVFGFGRNISIYLSLSIYIEKHLFHKIEGLFRKLAVVFLCPTPDRSEY